MLEKQFALSYICGVACSTNAVIPVLARCPCVPAVGHSEGREGLALG